MNETTATQVRVHEANVAEFEAKVDKANRRLVRHGIEGRFGYHVADKTVVEHKDGSSETTYLYEFDSAPHFEYSGWEFLATVQIEEGGTIMRVAPGATLPRGYERPDTHICEHCGVRRHRTRSYIVRSTETGEVKQIGHNCIELFLGVQVKGLWALGWLPEADEDEDWDRPARNWAPTRWNIDYVLRLAWIVTDEGHKFVSRTTAREYEDKRASADEVGYVLTYRPYGNNWRTRIETARVNELRARATEVPQEVVDTLRAYPEQMGESDYAENLRVLNRGTTLDHTNMGLLVSLVGVWRRAQERDAERQREAERRAAERAAKSNEWVGKEKERLRGLELTVVLNRQWDTDFGTQTMLLFEDADGNTFKWVASRWLGYDAGDKLRITGTVKALDTYNGIKPDGTDEVQN